jgi:CRISPR system Cascade subunit CasB
MDLVKTGQSKSFYLGLWDKYQQLGNGAKADIKKVSVPRELLSVGAFFRLCKQENDLLKYANVVFILPWLSHKKGVSLGSVFYGDPKHRVSEARMIQLKRSDYPQDIVGLRRIIWQAAGRHAEQSVDWEKLGPQLFYWGDANKQKILEDYYIAEIKANKTEGE